MWYQQNNAKFWQFIKVGNAAMVDASHLSMNVRMTYFSVEWKHINVCHYECSRNFSLSQYVLDRINASCRNFLWDKVDIGKNKSFVVWWVVCSPKKEGDLDLFNLKDGTLRFFSVSCGTFIVRNILYRFDGFTITISKGAMCGIIILFHQIQFW